MLKAKKNVCVQTIYCIKDTIYCFLVTYLLLDTRNFARSGIRLSEDSHVLSPSSQRVLLQDLLIRSNQGDFSFFLNHEQLILLDLMSNPRRDV